MGHGTCALSLCLAKILSVPEINSLRNSVAGLGHARSIHRKNAGSKFTLGLERIKPFSADDTSASHNQITKVMAEREGFYTAVPKFPTRLAKSLLLKDRVSAHC